MHCFTTPHDVTLNVRGNVRTFKQIENPESADPERIYVVTPGEERLVREYLTQKYPAPEGITIEKPEQVQASGIRYISEEQLLNWGHMPARLGRKTRPPHTILTDPEPLTTQLAQLRQSKPAQKHFRFAVINGFGTNLGDTLMGMTAMRVVAQHFARHFPSFSVDILYGVDSASENPTMARAPWIAQQLFQGPTLMDFTRYDGWFDFSSLLSEQGYGTRPVVDWYIWWMGLDPERVTPEEKRNTMELGLSDWTEAANLLRKHTKPDCLTVWFAPDASVKLRSMPHEEACRIVRGILDSVPNCILFVDKEMIQHPRLVQLNRPSLKVYMALLAQVDGVITVDTVSTHAADAFSKPCVTLYTSVPGDIYPYYPHCANMPIPEYETLPAYKKCKVDVDEWEKIEKSYVQAWHNLSPMQVWKALIERIEYKKKNPETLGVQITAQTPSYRPRIGCRYHQGREEHLLPYEQNSELWTHTQMRLKHIIQGILPRGGTCVLAGAGQSALTIALAEHLGDTGTVHIVEPRRERLQLLSTDLAHAGFFAPQMHTFMPVASDLAITFNATDPLSETHPEQWGNLIRKTSIPCKPVDSLGLSDCQAILVQWPMPFADVMRGIKETLSKRPVIAAIPVPREEMLAVCQAIGTGYAFWGSAVPGGDPQTTSHFLLLATPEEKKTNLEGFARIQIN